MANKLTYQTGEPDILWTVAKRQLFTDCELEVETIPAAREGEIRRPFGKAESADGNVKILLLETKPQVFIWQLEFAK